MLLGTFAIIALAASPALAQGRFAGGTLRHALLAAQLVGADRFEAAQIDQMIGLAAAPVTSDTTAGSPSGPEADNENDQGEDEAGDSDSQGQDEAEDSDSQGQDEADSGDSEGPDSSDSGDAGDSGDSGD